jgi:hypothetical protein
MEIFKLRNPAQNSLSLKKIESRRTLELTGREASNQAFNLAALDHYVERSAGRSLTEGLQRYGPGTGNPGGRDYGTAVAGIANGIRNGINGSIRTTGFYQRYEVRSILGLVNKLP